MVDAYVKKLRITCYMIPLSVQHYDSLDGLADIDDMAAVAWDRDMADTQLTASSYADKWGMLRVAISAGHITAYTGCQGTRIAEWDVVNTCWLPCGAEDTPEVEKLHGNNTRFPIYKQIAERLARHGTGKKAEQ